VSAADTLSSCQAAHAALLDRQAAPILAAAPGNPVAYNNLEQSAVCVAEEQTAAGAAPGAWAMLALGRRNLGFVCVCVLVCVGVCVCVGMLVGVCVCWCVGVCVLVCWCCVCVCPQDLFPGFWRIASRVLRSWT
jgi:hypothetical protein